MIFVLDNYDSFTYNLVQYFGELGEEIVVRRNDQTTVDEVEAFAPERIVISPGPCTPQEAGMKLHYVPYIPNRHEAFILGNRKILGDQMEFLIQGVPKSSRIHLDT